MKAMKISAVLGAGAILLSSLTGPSVAGSLGVGISGQGVLLSTGGQETLKSSSVVTKKDNVDEAAIAVSGYIEYTFGEDGFVIGLEKIPGDAELGSKTSSRTDITTTEPGSAVTQLAKAKVGNHFGAYVETPTFGGFFLKAGISEVTITTQEVLGTGATYPDASGVQGTTVGMGWRSSESGLQVKFVAEHTEFDEITLTSNSDTASTIKADTEMTGAKLSIGYKF